MVYRLQNQEFGLLVVWLFTVRKDGSGTVLLVIQILTW